tara:strand:+ start:19897 stop:20616 length:720 start_codon:yes stop_codon:yes gene_type:complete
MKSIAKNYKLILASVGLILLLASIGVHYFEEFKAYRFLRGFISIAFLCILIYYKQKQVNPLIATFLLIYATSSFATIWYENETMAVVALLLNFISFLFIVKALWKQASFKNLGVFLSIVFVVFIIVNAFMLYRFINMLKDFTVGNLQYAAMLLGAMVLVITGFLVLLYNHACNTKASLVFALAMFLFIFAEIFRALAYYDLGFGNLFVFIARGTLILATALVIHFCLMNKTPKEQLSRR